MTTSPQDDLTAERAAELLKKLGVYPWPYRIEQIIAHDKTARQEALREARQSISRLFDENQSGTPEYYCALLDAGNELDRLAREGREE